MRYFLRLLALTRREIDLTRLLVRTDALLAGSGVGIKNARDESIFVCRLRDTGEPCYRRIGDSIGQNGTFDRAVSFLFCTGDPTHDILPFGHLA